METARSLESFANNLRFVLVNYLFPLNECAATHETCNSHAPTQRWYRVTLSSPYPIVPFVRISANTTDATIVPRITHNVTTHADRPVLHQALFWSSRI